MLTLLQGRFRVAIVDPQRERALLAVDRVASLPIYYTTARAGTLRFASSLDDIRDRQSSGSAVLARALLGFFYFHVVRGPETIYRGVQKLLPGQCLSFEHGRAVVSTYWEMPYVEPRHVRPTEARALEIELRDVLRHALARSIGDDGPPRLGVFLSGGLDTSTVLGMATEHVADPVGSVTVRFDVPGYDESPYARLVARHFGAIYHECTVTPDDMVDALHLLARRFSEPFGNSSAAGVLCAARLARNRGMRVLLSGDGGDELFAGSEVDPLMLKFECYARLPRPVRAAVDALSHLPLSDRVRAIRRARSYLRRARVPLPARLRTYESLDPTSSRRIFTSDFLAVAGPDSPLDSMIRLFERTTAVDPLQRMLHYALDTTIATDDVQKVRQLCDAAGITARFPLLEDDVLAFAARVPPGLLLRRFRVRAFFRDAMRGYLPAEVIQKKKQCFGHPIREWLTTPTSLRAAVVEAGRAFGHRGIVRDDYLTAFFARSASWSVEDAAFACDLAAFELWARAHGIDGWV